MDALPTKEIQVFQHNAEARIMEIAYEVAVGNSRSISFKKLISEGIILLDELELLTSNI